MAVTRRWKIVTGAVAAALVAAVVATWLVRFHRRTPIGPPPPSPVTALVGAVIEQAADPRGQAPIADAEVSVAHGLATGTARTDFSGLFRLTLRPGVVEGQPITLLFTQPGYKPLTLPVVAGDQLYVARMEPLHPAPTAQLVSPGVKVASVVLRYSVPSTTTATVGTEAKTFQVVNTANIPCDHTSPCSPDGRWKAGVATVSLDAGPGNILADPRVSCIAGPCPFTRTHVQDILKAGRIIEVQALSWSDTTTFLIQGEVVQAEVGDVVQTTYPVIFDRELNFSLPATAKGPSLEATLNGLPIIFPLPPKPDLTWLACNVRQESDRTRQYRCHLKPGYAFQPDAATGAAAIAGDP